MSELIVAGFDDGHTAFLARAALARLQKRLSLSGHDLAVITREEGNEVILQQVIELGDEEGVREAFWKTLTNLLFAADCSIEKGGKAAEAKLAAIGINGTFRRRIAKLIRPGTAALLVLVSEPAVRDEVLGVLRGLQGEIVRILLTADDREPGPS